MGKKWPSDIAEKRRAKRSEHERALAEAHAERLANDPEFVAKLEQIERGLENGTWQAEDGLTAEEFRRRYMKDHPDA